MSPKLQSPREGPYTVLDCVSDVTYRIRLGSHGRPKVVHSDKLWRYYGPGSYSWDSSSGVDPPTPGPAISDEEELDELHEEEDGLASVMEGGDRVTQDEARGEARRTPRPQRYRRLPSRFQNFQMQDGD